MLAAQTGINPLTASRRTAMSQSLLLWTVAPRLALLLTLPDPPIDPLRVVAFGVAVR
jgi:hypothetical protein